jgi:hypothetical protein
MHSKRGSQQLVFRIADANHYIFISNEPQVLAAMNTFLATLH